VLRRRRIPRGALEAPERTLLDPHEVLTGTVVAFDEHVGLGVVAVDGGQPIPFHCIVVDDGSRSVEVGQTVLLRVGASYRGTVEATWVHKLV